MALDLSYVAFLNLDVNCSPTASVIIKERKHCGGRAEASSFNHGSKDLKLVWRFVGLNVTLQMNLVKHQMFRFIEDLFESRLWRRVYVSSDGRRWQESVYMFTCLRWWCSRFRCSALRGADSRSVIFLRSFSFSSQFTADIRWTLNLLTLISHLGFGCRGATKLFFFPAAAGFRCFSAN